MIPEWSKKFEWVKYTYFAYNNIEHVANDLEVYTTHNSDLRKESKDLLLIVLLREFIMQGKK